MNRIKMDLIGVIFCIGFHGLNFFFGGGGKNEKGCRGGQPVVAERGGFEPPIRFWRIHAFQACLFSHSSITPFARALLAMRNCRCATNASAKIVKFCLIVAKFL